MNSNARDEFPKLHRWWGWIFVLPVAALLYAALGWLLPALVGNPVPGYGVDLFLADTGKDLLPEPREQAGYLLAIALAPLLFTGLALFLKRKLSWFREAFSPKVTAVWAVFSQALVLACACFMWAAHMAERKPCFALPELMTAAVLACAAVYLLLSGRAARSFECAEEAGERVPVLFYAVGAEVLCFWILLPSIFTDTNISEALVNVRAHIPFIVDEFSAVLNGRVILVDYFPQYQKLLSYFMAPYFALFGTGTLSFTIGMGVLSMLGLMSVYFTFQLAVRRKLFAFLLFIGFLGSCALASNRYMAEMFYMFNYYPMSPVRYLAPWMGGLLLAFYLRAPSEKKLWLLAGFCALAALNNPDFGIPVLVGSFAALCLGRGGVLFAPPGKIKKAFAAFAVSSSVVLLLFALGTRLLGGQWPRFAEMFMYQKIFAATGFMQLPMPEAGLHWLLYFTFMAGIAAAVSGALYGGAEEEGDVIGPLLMFASVAACGMGMYYVGRSHLYVLPALFPAWYFVLALLLLRARQSLGGVSALERLSSVVPLWLVAFHMLALGLLLPSLPSPLSEMKRLGSGSGEFSASYGILVELTKKYTVPGEKVGIVCMYAHNIAQSAGVDNVFPFAHRGSLLLKSQVSEAVSAFERNCVTKVFGILPPELEQELLSRGFSAKPLVTNGVYTMWRKSAQ